MGGPLHSLETLCRELCKMAEPIAMPYEMPSGVGSGNHVLDMGWWTLAPPDEYD